MKLLLVLMLAAVAAAATTVDKVETYELNSLAVESYENRNVLMNSLIRQLFNHLRRIINNGSPLFGIPPLDPLNLNHYHLYVPAGLINLDLDLKKINVTGFGGFEVHRSHGDLSDFSLDLDISLPSVDIRADEYDLVGDLFTAIPLYGKGRALFKIEDFRFRAKVYLMQSEDGKSVLIKSIENASFVMPSIKSQLTGVIGGGNIDNIVNAMVEEVVVDYANRFQGAIATIASGIIADMLNPLLSELDSWRYIKPLLPRSN